jgi:hypothetical protein
VRAQLVENGTEVQVKVIVELTRAAEIFRAKISMSGAVEGERTIEDASPTCAPLGDAVALSIALAIEEARAKSIGPDGPDGVRTSTAGAARTPARAISPEQEPRAEKGEPIALDLEIGGGAAIGVVRQLAPLETLGLSLRLGFARIGLSSLLIYPEQSLALAPGTIDVTLAGANATGCLALADAPEITLLACLSGTAAAVRARARGFSTNRTESRAWIAGGLAAIVRGALFGPIHWYVREEALLPAQPQAFAVDNVGTAYTPPPLSLLSSVGLTMTVD